MKNGTMNKGTTNKGTTNKDKAVALAKPKGRSVGTFASGIKTSADFARGMSELMADLALGNMTPQIAAAICNAGGKLLKVHEMQHRYGVQGASGGKQLALA